MFTRFKESRRVSNAPTTSSAASSMLSPSETTTISTFRNSHDDLSLSQSPRQVDVIDELYDFFSDDTTVAQDDIVAFEITEKQYQKRQAFIQQLFDFESDYVNRLHVILLYFKRPISMHYHPLPNQSKSTQKNHHDNRSRVNSLPRQQQQQQQQNQHQHPPQKHSGHYSSHHHHQQQHHTSLLSPFLSKQPSSSSGQSPSSSLIPPNSSFLSNVTLNIHDMDVLFGAIDPLYKLHEAFLEKLSERFQIWSSLQLLSDIIHFLLDAITPLYNTYLENYPKMMAILEIIGKSRENKNLLEAVVTNPGGIGQVYLFSLLQHPLYSIAQYNQLITDIIKLTDFNHPDVRQLKSAQHRLQAIYHEISPRIDICQNINQLMEMSLNCTGCPLVMDQPRQWLKRGKLCSVEGKTNDLRICFLISDQLITARPNGNNRGLHYKSSISLKGATIKTVNRMEASFIIIENATDSSYQYSDDIEMLLNATGSSPPRQHHFKTDADDLHGWVRELQSAVQALRRNM